MRSTRLILGIGNESKQLLKILEIEFPAWQFAILDCWSKVQEVKAVDKHLLYEEIQLCYVYNLNYYIRQPKVDVRFDETKYDDAETQKITSYLPHYIDLLEKGKPTHFSNVLKTLERYTEILIVCPADDGISLVWLHSLVSELQPHTNIRIFSWYPFVLEGQLKIDLAATLCEQLMGTSATHYCFFSQDILEQLKQRSMKEVFTQLDDIKKQTIKLLLCYEAVSDKNIVLL